MGSGGDGGEEGVCSSSAARVAQEVESEGKVSEVGQMPAEWTADRKCVRALLWSCSSNSSR